MSYRFTMDFNVGGGAFANLTKLINDNGLPTTIIEVGVFEGRTTCWMAEQIGPHNKNLKIYAVDPHTGSTDMSEDFNEIRSNFLNNIQFCEYGSCIEHLSKPSFEGLVDLIDRQIMAEIVYVDGDHRAAGVLEDLVLSWRLLRVGGIMLCDDTTTWKYIDKNGTSSAQMSPRMAVEAFIQCNWHKLKILSLPDATQTAIVKMAE